MNYLSNKQAVNFPKLSDILPTSPPIKSRWIKFLNDNQTHRTIKYEEGKVVEDTILFTPEGECKSGGLYFTDYANCVNWHKYYGSNKVACIELCLEP